MIDKEFWKGKKVFITGHTGFKGAWLCLWLHSLGAKITGYSLPPLTTPSMYDLCNINDITQTIYGDIRNYESLLSALTLAEPDIIFHLAAQPIVTISYEKPIETYETNVMGTLYLLEAIKAVTRKKKKIKAVINITSDKCYENKESIWGYRENDPMGGYDPYSNSKACSELVTSTYRNSFFNPNTYKVHGVALASARAGNVIGGGDWSVNRLIPDCMSSLLNNEPIKVRNPQSIRPWQHVLEPLSGYLTLAQKLYNDGIEFAQGWNFGPNEDDAKPVSWIVDTICKKWGNNTSYIFQKEEFNHEANYLKLDCSKSKHYLSWVPKWRIDYALNKVIEWTIAFRDNKNLREISLAQIEEFNNTKPEL